MSKSKYQIVDALRAVFSIPIPICHDLGVGIGITGVAAHDFDGLLST
jgi:hypothetical protein